MAAPGDPRTSRRRRDAKGGRRLDRDGLRQRPEHRGSGHRGAHGRDGMRLSTRPRSRRGRFTSWGRSTVHHGGQEECDRVAGVIRHDRHPRHRHRGVTSGTAQGRNPRHSFYGRVFRPSRFFRPRIGVGILNDETCLHLDRTAGRDRDHRDPRRHPVSRVPRGEGSGLPDGRREQRQGTRRGGDPIRERQRRAVHARDGRGRARLLGLVRPTVAQREPTKGRPSSSTTKASARSAPRSP